MVIPVKAAEDIMFEDMNFRLVIRPDCVSSIDHPSRLSKALHEEIELKYFYEGSTTLLVGSQTVVAEAGDLVIMNPYELHSTIRFGAEKGKYHLIMIDPDFFFEKSAGGFDLRRKLLGGELRFSTLVRGDAYIEEIIRRAVELQKTRPAYFHLSLRGLMLELFAHILRDHAIKLGKDEGSGEHIRYFEMVEPAIQRIRDGYREKISTDDLAMLCRVSKCHFCRIFKKATGQTAMQYLTDYRLKIADVILKGSGKSVAEVAALCGFEDDGYFCRCYKRKFGDSPGKSRTEKTDLP